MQTGYGQKVPDAHPLKGDGGFRRQATPFPENQRGQDTPVLTGGGRVNKLENALPHPIDPIPDPASWAFAQNGDRFKGTVGRGPDLLERQVTFIIEATGVIEVMWFANPAFERDAVAAEKAASGADGGYAYPPGDRPGDVGGFYPFDRHQEISSGCCGAPAANRRFR